MNLKELIEETKMGKIRNILNKLRSNQFQRRKKVDKRQNLRKRNLQRLNYQENNHQKEQEREIDLDKSCRGKMKEIEKKSFY